VPYDRIEQLPDEIRSVLPAEAQRIFLEVFNSSYDGTCKGRNDRESCAMKIAWNAVGKGYKRTESGEWVKNMETERITVFSNITVPKTAMFENTILQTLNRWIPNPESGHYFAFEAFEQNVDSWKGVPVVFAKTHPDPNEFSTSQVDALEKINGRVIGMVNSARLEKEGHPRLMGSLGITDPEALALWKEGKLSLSTAFLASVNKQTRAVEGGIEPNHVLLFEEDEGNLPKDLGTLVNGPDGKNAIVNSGRVISAKNKSLIDRAITALQELTSSLISPEMNSESSGSNAETPDNSGEDDMEKVEELTQKLELANKAAETATSEVETLKTAISNKDAEILELKNKVEDADKKFAAIEADKKTAKFEAFVQKHVLPGDIATPEAKEALRNRYENDPQGLMDEMLSHKKTAETKRDGFGHVQSNDKKGTTTGTFNPETKTWE
jgi:cation transport regulator